MRSFLLLNLLSNAVGSVAKDSRKENHLRSRGLSSSWQRVPGQASPFVPEVVPEVVEDVVEDVLEDTNDAEKDIVIVYEEEGDGEDEAIAVLFKDFEGEDEIIAGMATEGHGTTKETVRWTKGRNKRRGPNNKRRGPRGQGDAPKGKEGQRKKGKEKTPANMEAKSSAPTVAPTPIQVVDTVITVDTVDTVDAGDVSTSNPATVPPGPANSTPTTDDVFSWTESTPNTVPACPAHYSASVTYVAGDTVEEYSRIYECQPPPYEAYCNVVELDESWDAAQKKLWKDAWARVSNCEKAAVEEEASEEVAVEDEMLVDPAEDEALEDLVEDEASEDPIAEPAATTATATEAPIVIETPRPPPCPSDYDASRTTYAAGDRVTVKSHVFKCSEEAGYETYCNIAAWDDDLLTENEEAKEMWTHAWEDMGACEPTHEELMEEEAGA